MIKKKNEFDCPVKMKKRAKSRMLDGLRSRIRDAYWKKTKPKIGQRRLTFGEEVRRAVARRKTSQNYIPEDIQLWLLLYDEVVGFWFLTWAVYRNKLDREKPVSKQSACLTALAGRIFQDLLSVRELIERGFFVQSNVVARSLIENIDVMHLISSDPGIAETFQAVQSNEQASEFWHTHCSRGKINRYVKERWHWFLSDSAEAANSFHERRSDYLDLVGMSAHPSFAASFSSFMDSPKGQKNQNIAYAAMGTVSHMSKFTMHLILLRVFEFGMLWVGPTIGLYKGHGVRRAVPFRKELRRCLAVTMLDQEKNPSVFFPEFQTYWPRSNFK